MFKSSPYPLSSLALGKVLPDCYILDSLVGVYLHLFLGLICMSLITKETKYCLMYLLAIRISSVVKCFFQFLPIFFYLYLV